MSDHDQHLDAFALQVCQEANLGNDGNWFLSFRGGLYGVRSRIHGARYHSELLHGDVPRPAIPTAEHHIAVILYCMDSALECFVFMLNALGQAADPEGFWSVSIEKQLKRVSPRDILEDRCSGYQTLFPQVRQCWADHTELIRLVMENHDVAKHRTQTSQAGTLDLEGLGEPLGESPTPEEVTAYAKKIRSAPMKEVLMPRWPKLPVGGRSSDREDWTTLEEIEEGWEVLIAKSFQTAVEDARVGIPVIEAAEQK